MTTPISFHSFLLTRGALIKDGAGYLASTQAKKPVFEHHFSIEDIAQTDSRLPGVIEALLASDYGKRNGDMIYARPLNLTLHHWKNPDFIKDLFNRKHHIVRVTSVEQDYSPIHVELMANTYAEIHKIGDVEYVINSRDASFKVNKKELHRVFPGWEERYLLLKDLHADLPTLMSAVFPIAKLETAVDMTALSSFDLS